MMKFKTQTGQTILEIIVVLAVLSLVLVGLVTVVLNGLRNSQFSKNQAQATKLAQEGLDSVRIMTSREGCKVTSLGNDYYWINESSLVWNNSQVLDANKIYYVHLAALCQLEEVTSPEVVENNFKRSIKLEEDGAPDRIRVTATVEWSDVSGAHESKLVTILAQ